MALYEVNMQHSDESLAALSRMQYDLFSKKSRVVRTLMSLGFVLLGVAYFSRWWGVLALAYGGYLSTGTYNYGNYKARKIARQIREAGLDFPASRYLFEKDHLHILALPEEKECDEPLPYSSFVRLGEDAENFYLFPTQYGGYVIPRAALAGREDAFKAFIEEKTGKYFESRRSPLRQLQDYLRHRSREPYHL